MSRFSLLFCFGLCALLVRSAHAKGPSEKEIQQLETLSELGQDACHAEEFQKCQRAFEQAQELFAWAPHEFYIAEALVGQGKLVEGSALWNKILKENDPDDCHPSVCQAVRKARLRLNQVDPQIPKVSFAPAQDYDDLRVEWAGSTLTQTQLAQANPVNPGEYRLVASSPDHQTLRETHRLSLGQKRKIPLELIPSRAGGSDSSAATRRWPAPLGIALAAAGGAALVGGIATWSSKNNKLEDYKGACADRTPACQRSDADAAQIESLTTVGNTLFVGGGLLLAAGTTVLVWHWSSDEDADKDQTAGFASIRVGALELNLAGTF